MKPKNDVLTLIFLIIGMIAAADLVFVQLRQQANEQRAQERLACVAQVVKEAQANMVYNTVRDNATKDWLLNSSPGPGAARAVHSVQHNQHGRPQAWAQRANACRLSTYLRQWWSPGHWLPALPL